MDWSKLMDILPLAMSAVKPGSPEAAAFNEGYLRSMRELDARKHRDRQFESSELWRNAQTQNMQADNTRQQQAFEQSQTMQTERAALDRLSRGLTAYQPAIEGVAETATDPIVAENELMRRGSSLETAFGIPSGQLTATMPPMTPILSQRKKKRAQEIYEQAEKRFGTEAMAGDSITLQTGELFGDIKPSALRALFETPAVTEAGLSAQPFVGKKTPAAPGSFEEYSTADPTRKAAILADRKAYMQADDRPFASQMPTASGANPRDVAVFNQIAGAYDRSPLVRASDRTIVLNDAIQTIEKNPSDPSAQLRLAYSYIQALDTYQSAVREGELGNLGVLGTKLQQWGAQLNRVAFEGAFLPPAVALNIANDAKQLVQTIDAGRQRKAQEFGSRAKVSGVGAMWDDFIGGLASQTPLTTPPPAPTPAGANSLPPGLRGLANRPPR